MLKTDLPAPDVIDIRQFNCRPQDIRAAVSIKHDLIRLAKKLRPYSVYRVALQHFRDEPGNSALNQLCTLVSNALRDLERHRESFEALKSADDDRLHPAVSAAGRRHLRIECELIPLIDYAIQKFHSDQMEKRKHLEEAGVGEADIERLLSSEDVSIDDLIAEKSALEAENQALVQFLQTKDESLLPADSMPSRR
jgi:hypothetical protein